MRVKTYAKINLSLEVLSKREDGYSNIDTIMQPIDLWDEMTFTPGGDRFLLETNDETLPLDEGNLITRAYRLLQEEKRGEEGLRVHLLKNIPVAAGLAGGTSNGAATLKALNEIRNLELSREELKRRGLKLGADFPYFFHETTLRARGIGEKIEELPPLPRTPILLINSGQRVSTALAYARTTPCPEGEERIQALLHYYETEDWDRFYSALYNRLEEGVIPLFPQIAKIKEELLELGARAALMSGSGPTVFGIFRTEKERDRAAKLLSPVYERVMATWTR